MPDWDQAQSDLEASFKRWYPILLNKGAAEAGAELGMDLSIDSDDADEVMQGVAKNVKGILDTQRDRVASYINTLDGDELVAALQDALDTTEQRAQLIASTEISITYNIGKALAAESVDDRVGIRLTDGDGDAACVDVDGKLASPAWYRENPIGHPGCSRDGSLELMSDDDEYDLE